MKTINEVNRNDCIGCELCRDVCAKNAISMAVEDFFYYPHIDQSKCIKCGKCFASCPANSPKMGRKAVKAYMLVTKDAGIYKASEAGGFFSTAAKYIVKDRKGIAVGSAVDELGHVGHICVDNVKDIKKLQGGKYVQSAMDDAYKDMEVYLKGGKRLIFGGTPCQVSAVRQKFGANSNIYLVDFICDGVSSPVLFEEDIASIFPHGEKIEEIDFTDKNISTDFRTLKILGQWNELKVPWREDSYLSLLMEKATFRESCYRCQYFGDERQGDITMSMCQSHKEFRSNEIVSVIYINTQNGTELWEEIKDRFDYKEICINEGGIKEFLDHPVARPNVRDSALILANDELSTQAKIYNVKPRQRAEQTGSKIFPRTNVLSGIKNLIKKTNR